MNNVFHFETAENSGLLIISNKKPLFFQLIFQYHVNKRYWHINRTGDYRTNNTAKIQSYVGMIFPEVRQLLIISYFSINLFIFHLFIFFHKRFHFSCLNKIWIRFWYWYFISLVSFQVHWTFRISNSKGENVWNGRGFENQPWNEVCGWRLSYEFSIIWYRNRFIWRSISSIWYCFRRRRLSECDCCNQYLKEEKEDGKLEVK